MKTLLPLVALLFATASVRAQPVPFLETGIGPRTHAPSARRSASVGVPDVALAPRVAQGRTAPGAGTLEPLAFVNPGTLNATGSLAFTAGVDGEQRNQGVFVAHADGRIDAIAIGCGARGGGGDTTAACGDPSPLGGTFGGFFEGTFFAPAINAAGDVLFLADVNGGSARRALFLHRAATGAIATVAAVGDASPLGGTFGALGTGSLGDSGLVVFLAAPQAALASDIFTWKDGVVAKGVAVGDAAPGGGTYIELGTETLSFADGTLVHVGPVPDVNATGQIAFAARVDTGVPRRGILVRTGGVDQWYAREDDPAPAGGTYADFFGAPSINDAGAVAFSAAFRPTPDDVHFGWFAGAPGAWRRVVASRDALDGSVVLGTALSRNPMQSIATDGSVVFWTAVDGLGDRIVVGRPDGTLQVLARFAAPTPLGGTFGAINPWPALGGTNVLVGAGTPGASVNNAHFVAQPAALFANGFED